MIHIAGVAWERLSDPLKIKAMIVVGVGCTSFLSPNGDVDQRGCSW